MEEKETRGCHNCGVHKGEEGCAKDAFRECQTNKGSTGEFWEPKET